MQKFNTFFLLLLISTFCSNISIAQNEVMLDEEYTVAGTSTPAMCSELSGAMNCDGLVTEYMIVDLDVLAGDSLGPLIVSSSNSATFVPSELGLVEGNEYGVVPICYSLEGLKTLVQNMNESEDCCNVINFATPEGVEPQICDGIVMQFPSGDDVNSLADVLDLISNFGNPNMSVPYFRSVADQINGQMTVIVFGCVNATLIGYCVDPTPAETFITLPVNTNDLEAKFNAFQINPNPTDNALNFQIQSKENMEINYSILNIVGKEVKNIQTTINQGENWIVEDISNLESGAYFLRINSGDQSTSKKFIKK